MDPSPLVVTSNASMHTDLVGRLFKLVSTTIARNALPATPARLKGRF